MKNKWKRKRFPKSGCYRPGVRGVKERFYDLLRRIWFRYWTTDESPQWKIGRVVYLCRTPWYRHPT